MSRTTLDLWVGVFVAIGIAALLFLALKVGSISGSGIQSPYTLSANFDNIGGLKVRAPVKSAGVVVGIWRNIAVVLRVKFSFNAASWTDWFEFA